MIISGFGFGSSGTITRNIDANAWQIASWRGLTGGAGVLVYVSWRARRDRRARLDRLGSAGPDGPARAQPRQSRQRAGRLGPTVSVKGLVLTSLSAASMILFITALQRTAIANVSVIMATIPFIAAALAWLMLREPLRRSTVIASAVSFAGVDRKSVV